MSARTQSTYRIDANEVRREAAGRWVGILSQLAPPLRPALSKPGEHFECPVHSSARAVKLRNGLRAFDNVGATGGMLCNTCGPKPDGFAVLMWVNGWNFPQALENVHAALHGSSPPKHRGNKSNSNSRKASPVEKAKPQPRPLVEMDAEVEPEYDPTEDRRKWQSMCRFWSLRKPLGSTEAVAARRYLYRRGVLTNPLPDDIVCVERAGYYEAGQHEGTFPAMTAAFRGADGKAVAIHRTYLTASGERAPVELPKKMMAVPKAATVAGGAVRLFEAPHGVLGVAEGIETALAAHVVWQLPVWACLSNTLLQTFDPPPWIHTIYVFADKDLNGAGLGSAQKLVERMTERGIPCKIILPPIRIAEGKNSVDWNDVIHAYDPKIIRRSDWFRDSLKFPDA